MLRTALAVSVMLLAGCAARHANLEPAALGKSTEADITALQAKQPTKTVIAPNGAKNVTFPDVMMNAAPDAPNQTTYIFGTDGKLRHIIWETPSGHRYLLLEKTTAGILPDEIVGPMPTVVEISVKRVS